MSQPQGGDKEQKVLALNPQRAKVPENKLLFVLLGQFFLKSSDQLVLLKLN